LKKIFSPIKKALMFFSQNIIIPIINCILSALVYFIGIALTSIIAKILRKHFLELKTKDQSTYWKDVNIDKEEKNNYYRQF